MKVLGWTIPHAGEPHVITVVLVRPGSLVFELYAGGRRVRVGVGDLCDEALNIVATGLGLDLRVLPAPPA